MSDAGFEPLALEGVRSLMPYQPGKPVEELERELGLTGSVKLASNENPLGPGEAALAAAHAALAESGRYPDGGGFHLRHALAAHLDVAPERITLGNGSNEVLELIARTFVTPAHEVVFSAHAFTVYPIVTQAIGARARVAPARDWGHDLEAMAALVGPDTRLVFIANPNNPTGTWVDERALTRFLDAVPRSVLVVLDEAYFEYVEAPGYPDGMRLAETRPNVVVTRTFSKIHGLAALRVGYAVSHPQIAELVNRVREPFNVNSVGQAAAIAALADDAHVERSRDLNRGGMAALAAGLERLDLGYIPSVGNFVSVDVGAPAGPVYEALLARGVIVRPIAGYGMPDHLRVSIGTAEENRRFLDAMADVLGRTGS